MTQSRPATTTLYLRNVNQEAAERIRRAASARLLTLAEYFSKLEQLHAAMRERADAGNADFQVVLKQLGLETVSFST